MVKPTIKGTYTLDAETVRTLETLARRWRTSKSAALRRVIRAAALERPDPSSKLAALDQLQKQVGLSKAAAARWEAEVRKERQTR